jgi:hypothetical protein
MQTPIILESYPDGSTVERPMTADEAAQYEVDQADAAAATAAAEAAAATAAANGAAAIAHAKSLGFTDAMISEMYPALVTVAP